MKNHLQLALYLHIITLHLRWKREQSCLLNGKRDEYSKARNVNLSYIISTPNVFTYINNERMNERTSRDCEQEGAVELLFIFLIFPLSVLLIMCVFNLAIYLSPRTFPYSCLHICWAYWHEWKESEEKLFAQE